MIPLFPSSIYRTVWRVSLVLPPLLLVGACNGNVAPDAYFAADIVTLGAPLSTVVATRPVRASPPSPTPATSAGNGFCGLPGFQTDLLKRINAARASARSCGGTAYPAAGPLTWNGRLFAAAESHSRNMADNNDFSHTGVDGRSVVHRVRSAGYAWRSVGENIAAGPPGASAVMSGWLASPGHCGNIMNAQFQDVAVACVMRSGSTYGHYWTMVLARSS